MNQTLSDCNLCVVHASLTEDVHFRLIVLAQSEFNPEIQLSLELTNPSPEINLAILEIYIFENSIKDAIW